MKTGMKSPGWKREVPRVYSGTEGGRRTGGKGKDSGSAQLHQGAQAAVGRGIVGQRLGIKVLRSCVFSKLLYGLHTTHFGTGLQNRINAFQLSCSRKALRIKKKHVRGGVARDRKGHKPGSSKGGGPETPNGRYTKAAIQITGTRPQKRGDDPLRSVSYDRFGEPRMLGGTNKWGRRREQWTQRVLEEASTAIEGLGAWPQAGHQRGRTPRDVAALASDRNAWRKWVDEWHSGRGWENFEPRRTQGAPGTLSAGGRSA